ncbi:MAG: hypothetical protein ABR570_05380 [Burkholderiales bacterium]
MARRSTRQTAMRAQLAAAAARIMAEDGVDDFALAKRKAARRLGVADTQALPGNDEVEAELRAYRALYQAQDHEQVITELRRVALEAMRALEQFNPYLTGPVFTGTAGPYAEIELQLFPDSAKEVEIFLLDRDLPFKTQEARRYAGDRPHSVSLISLDWHGQPLRLAVFDARDERFALKTSVAGKVVNRGNISEVSALLRGENADKKP